MNAGHVLICETADSRMAVQRFVWLRHQPSRIVQSYAAHPTAKTCLAQPLKLSKTQYRERISCTEETETQNIRLLNTRVQCEFIVFVL